MRLAAGSRLPPTRGPHALFAQVVSDITVLAGEGHDRRRQIRFAEQRETGKTQTDRPARGSPDKAGHLPWFERQPGRTKQRTRVAGVQGELPSGDLHQARLYPQATE